MSGFTLPFLSRRIKRAVLSRKNADAIWGDMQSQMAVVADAMDEMASSYNAGQPISGQRMLGAAYDLAEMADSYNEALAEEARESRDY